MPITPCFDPTTGASGGAAPGGGGTEPGLTVTGRTDGEAYTVSAGARALTISNPDGATLSTTVEKASDGSAVTVTGSTTTSPSWTAPGGGATGEAVQVKVSATLSGLSSSVSFTERVAGAGSTGESWVRTLDLDLTALTSTTLSAGNNTVDGYTIDSEAAGATVGGGSGLSSAATKYVFVDIASYFSAVENPKLVVLKTVNTAFGGTGTGHAVRARLMSTSAGAAPSAQTRIYPTSGGAMAQQMQYQIRYPTSTGTFTSVPAFNDSGKAGVLVWYHHIACVRGTWFSWVTETVDVPTDLADLLTPDARTCIGGINGYQVTGSAAYWPSTVWAGLFNQNSGSLATLDAIEVYEFR